MWWPGRRGNNAPEIGHGMEWKAKERTALGCGRVRKLGAYEGATFQFSRSRFALQDTVSQAAAACDGSLQNIGKF